MMVVFVGEGGGVSAGCCFGMGLYQVVVNEDFARSSMSIYTSRHDRAEGVLLSG